MLPDSPDVEAVVVGPDGILAGARPGLIHIDMSTISATTTRRMAALEAEYEVNHIDAPVSGGDIGARTPRCRSWSAATSTRCWPSSRSSKVMGKRIIHIGPVGCGQIAKACNQIMVAAQMVAMGELLVMAQKAGADPEKVVEAIKGGARRSAGRWTTSRSACSRAMRTPGFKASMQYKDLNIVMEMAKAYGVPLPGTAINTQLFNAMIVNGLGDLDNSAVISVLEQLAQIHLKTNEQDQLAMSS